MLRSKDTWGEGNGEWDENYFGSFGKKKLQKKKTPSLCTAHATPVFDLPLPFSPPPDPGNQETGSEFHFGTDKDVKIMHSMKTIHLCWPL